MLAIGSLIIFGLLVTTALELISRAVSFYFTQKMHGFAENPHMVEFFASVFLLGFVRVLFLDKVRRTSLCVGSIGYFRIRRYKICASYFPFISSIYRQWIPSSLLQLRFDILLPYSAIFSKNLFMLLSFPFSVLSEKDFSLAA